MIKRIRKWLGRTPFIKHVATLVSGSVLGQATGILISPILTRIYSVEEFGVLTLYTSILMLFSITSSGRYEQAIILPKNERGAINLVALSFGITIVVSALSILFVIAGGSTIVDLSQKEEVGTWLWLLPLSIMAFGLFNALNYWSIRNKRFAQISVAKVVDGLFGSGIKVGFGFWHILGAGGLIIGNMLGQLVSALILLFPSLKKDQWLFKAVTSNRMKKMAVRHKEFPTINLPHAAMDVIQLNLVTFLITEFYGLGVLGAYGHAIRIMKTPSSLIGISISQVFFQRASEMKKPEIRKLFLQTLKSIAALLILPFTALLLWGDDLFAWVFSEEWRMAGAYSQILSPWLYLSMVTSVFSVLPVILNRQRAFLFINLAEYVLATAGLLITSIMMQKAGNGESFEVSLMVFSGIAALFNFYKIAWYFTLLRNK